MLHSFRNEDGGQAWFPQEGGEVCEDPVQALLGLPPFRGSRVSILTSAPPTCTLCLSTVVMFLAPLEFTLPRSLQSARSPGVEQLPTRRRAVSARMALEELWISALEELANGDLLERGVRDTQVAGAQPMCQLPRVGPPACRCRWDLLWRSIRTHPSVASWRPVPAGFAACG